MAKKRPSFRARSSSPGRIECRFLVPLLRDSNRRPHAPSEWRALLDALRHHFDGFTGPEGPVPGDYKNRAGRWVTDRSLRFTLALFPEGVARLRALLRQVAHTFDQECIYFVVGVEVELVLADPSAGCLGDA